MTNGHYLSNWHLGENVPHHYKLCRLFAKPHNVLCAWSMQLKEQLTFKSLQWRVESLLTDNYICIICLTVGRDELPLSWRKLKCLVTQYCMHSYHILYITLCRPNKDETEVPEKNENHIVTILVRHTRQHQGGKQGWEPQKIFISYSSVKSLRCKLLKNQKKNNGQSTPEVCKRPTSSRFTDEWVPLRGSERSK
jgi:hypothetical protein